MNPLSRYVLSWYTGLVCHPQSAIQSDEDQPMPPKKLIYQFKITLKDISPPIWRRIQVPSTYTFYDLHVAIQDAMGWHDYHLHEFRIKAKTGESLVFGIPSEDGSFMLANERILAGWRYKISKYETIIPRSIVKP